MTRKHKNGLKRLKMANRAKAIFYSGYSNRLDWSIEGVVARPPRDKTFGSDHDKKMLTA